MRVADHPRSRGVYRRTQMARSKAGGSSPLARGLQILRRQERLDPRIIPARAGFTPTGAQRSPASTDHPRSRGVYTTVHSLDYLPVGSSPLARGLRRLPRRRAAPAGIIPARAGFTRRRCWPPRPRRDHPRSRGVYVDPGERGAHPVGIIPARAGFTRRPRSPRCGRPDHPRSRGVYAGKPSAAGVEAGSSPLARGLLPHGDPVADELGIIPARAGFTRRFRPRTPGP